MLGNLRVVGFGALRRHDAVPAHPIAMKPFCIDANEKTVAEYQTLMQGPSHLPWPTADNEAPYLPPASLLCTWTMPASYPSDAPMNCVDRDDAKRACEAAGGRLPTEAEWEYVATGMGRGTLFPWGDTPPVCETAVLERQATDFKIFPECEGPALELGTTQSVGGDRAFIRWKPIPAGASPDAPREAEEVWHLAGSLSEWMLDTFEDYATTASEANCWQLEGPRNHPACDAPGDTMSVRGGNFVDDLEVAYSALRFNGTATTHSDFIGFRCVYPVGGVDPVQRYHPTPVTDAGAPTPDGGDIDTPSDREGGL
jgi:formylglycine-generating enzyme required for sulfatase activity